MATNSIFTINGSTCSLVQRVSSQAIAASATSSAVSIVTASAASPTSSVATALPDIVTQASSTAQASTTSARVHPLPDTNSSDGAGQRATQSHAAATNTDASGQASSSPSLAAAGGTSAGQNQNHQSRGGNSVNAGAVVAVVLGLSLVLGVAAGAWFVLRRYRRRRDIVETFEKSPDTAEDADSREERGSPFDFIIQSINDLRILVANKFAGRGDAYSRSPESPSPDGARDVEGAAQRTNIVGMMVQSMIDLRTFIAEKLIRRGTENADEREEKTNTVEFLSQPWNDLRAYFVKRLARRSSGGSQRSNSPRPTITLVSTAPESSLSTPQRSLQKGPGYGMSRKNVFSTRLRGNNDSSNRGTLSEGDWFSKISNLRGRLFVTNPTAPTSNVDSMRSPGISTRTSGPPTLPQMEQLPELDLLNRSDPRRSRARSFSYPAIIGEAMTSELPDTESLDQTSTSSRPQSSVTAHSHYRRSTESSNFKHKFANRGPSFYPPTTGPLPTFDDIKIANPYMNEPPVPEIPPVAAWRRSDPLGPMDRQNKRDHLSNTSGSSSVVILPSIDAATRDLSMGQGLGDTGGREKDRDSNAGGKSAIKGRERSQISGRASSSILQASDGFANNNANNSNRNTLAWRFPSRTPSGTAYVFPTTKQGKRDTTWTMKSDPFDLER